MKKIKWKNLFKLAILLICISTIIHDLYTLTVYSWINSTTASWTSFGLLTFVFSGLLSEYLIEDLFN
jgi:uncharacterized membrane protein